jgi:hypothetical protein
MTSNPALEVSYNIANAPLRMYPYPHFYLQDVFPKDYYQELQANLPNPEQMFPIEKVRPVRGYKERFVMGMDDKSIAHLPQEKQDFWRNLSQSVCGERLANTILNKFSPFLQARFSNTNNVNLYHETLLIQDTTNYSIGPHTDSPRKVVSVLFYLPKDESQSDLGTSIYLPKDPNFTCIGGPHHSFEHFEKMQTMPFLPNCVFAFLKTHNSFHGVEKVVKSDTHRWLMLFDLYIKEGT